MIPAIVEHIAQLRRMDTYRIQRPDLIYDVPGISRWLRQHPDGGWLQTSQHDRDETAKRLTFLSYLRSRGEVTDDMLDRAIAVSRTGSRPTLEEIDD